MTTLYEIYLIANFMQVFYKCRKYRNQLQIKVLHGMWLSVPVRHPQRILRIR